MTERSAITPTRSENYAEWYLQVISAADMAENSPVRGCMIIKPWGYGIWELIQRELDRRIKETSHQNCYFPLLIPVDMIAAEAAHVEGFAKEMAVVTHHRLVQDGNTLKPDGKLEEPFVVRPTSEMIIGQAMKDWIKSYRELPLLLNQWANVMRWEMRPRLFLRTSEFLWQEGHTAHASKEEALAEVRLIIEIYRELVQDKIAVPVIHGEKPESERFPGAENTLCIEAMMQDGRALQAGTSHFLGQNFAKAIGIRFQDKAGVQQYCWTTSWGVSTRLIGMMIMTHSDDNGLRLPPAIAPQQLIIVPLIRSADQQGEVLDAAARLADRIRAQSWQGAPVRCHVDRREISAPEKRWEWIKKGVPIICELGPRDIASGVVTVTMRVDGPSVRKPVPIEELVATTAERLRRTRDELFAQADAYRVRRTVTHLTNYDDFVRYFTVAQATTDDGPGFVVAKWCGTVASEQKLKGLGVTIRCLPDQQSGSVGQCILTGAPAIIDAVFARAY
jgi:prolyl-tRNA synthetase